MRRPPQEFDSIARAMTERAPLAIKSRACPADFTHLDYSADIGSRTTQERNARGDGLSVFRVDPAAGIWTSVQVLRDLHHALISRLRRSTPISLAYSWLPGWWPSGRDEVRGGRLRETLPLIPVLFNVPESV